MTITIRKEEEDLPLIKSKILKRRLTGDIEVIEREQLETEILESISDENIEESEAQRILEDDLNVVDTGMLLQVKNVFYCVIDLDPGEIYYPPAAGVIAEAWKKGIITSEQVDKRLSDYRKAFKKNKKSS